MFDENNNTSLPDDVKDNNPLDGTNTQESTDQPTDDAKESFLNIKYNKEEVGLTREEAIELAQKGKNYDKVHGELESLRSSEGLAMLRELAEAEGMTVDEYAKEVKKQRELKAIKKEFNLDDKDSDKAETIYNDRLDANITRNQRKTEAEKREIEELSKQDTAKFMDYYEQTYGKALTKAEFEALPQEVFDMHAQGMSMTDAFVRHRLNVLEGRHKVDEINNSNSKANPGNIGNNGGNGPKTWTYADIAKMSPSEVAENLKDPEFRKIAYGKKS